MYTPKPIDTSKVKLSKELTKLKELISENIHEVWAEQRISEGWTLGPARDDVKKTTPCLIPYDELPDIEKAYDRNTAFETLKTIIALGYKIVDPAHQAKEIVPADEEELEPILIQLRQPSLKLATLTRIWESHNPELWATSSEVYRLLGKHLINVGAPFLAYDVLSEGCDAWPKDVKLQQTRAQALIKSGSIESANLIYRSLYYEGHTDGDTLGGLAKTHKELWQQATDPGEKQQQLESAYRVYKQSYELNMDWYTGINAATMAVFMGEKEISDQIAEKCLELCLADYEQQKKDPGSDLYWTLATIGEVFLIKCNLKEAEKWYAEAVAHGKNRFPYLSSTRSNARLLLEYHINDRHHFDHIFRIPPVAVFTGHIIDRPGRSLPRFPPEIADKVKEEIKARLKKLNIRFGYSSASCGSDILFLEALMELNGEAVIVLPYDRKRFKMDRVDIVPDMSWGDRFDRVMDAAAEITAVSEQRMEGGTTSFTYANLLLHGMAGIKADKLDTDLVPMAVWNEEETGSPGGTYDLVRHWQQLGYNIEIINPVRILTGKAEPKETAKAKPVKTIKEAKAELDGAASVEAADLTAQIKAMLFADAVNFSKLKEEQIPRFLKYFMGTIADLIKVSPHAPLMKNTWGDGLFFVFSNVQDAGLFALDLADKVSGTRWADKGLPPGLNLRVALHAGPVYECIDPVTGKLNYTGTHVSKTARIEPITPPGQVYASQSFVALALANNTRDFVSDYVGQVSLAKGYGVFPMYHVRRNTKK